MERLLSGAEITNKAVVYPWLCDSMGHLATQHTMAFFDDSAWHFLQMISAGMNAHENTGRGWADVRHEIDYKGEVKSGELVTVYTLPISIGATSVEYKHLLMRAGTDTVLTELRAITVRFDLAQRKSVGIELPIRKNVEAWLGRCAA